MAQSEKAWVPRILDYLCGAEALAALGLAYGRSLAIMILHDALEITIRSWLVYEKHRSPWDVQELKFHQLLAELQESYPTLSKTVLQNLAFMQTKRNSLVHDVAAGATTGLEYDRIRNSCVAAAEALLGEQLKLELLSPSLVLVPGARNSANGDETHIESVRLVGSGTKYYYQGRVPDAERLAREALALEPENIEALHLLGICERKHRRNGIALDNFLAAVKLPGGDRDIGLHLDIAETQLTLGRTTDARAMAGRSIELGARGPEHVQALAIIADAFAQESTFDKAAQYYRQALKEDDAQQRHVIGLIRSLRELRSYDEGLHLVDDFIDRSPKNAQYYLERARLAWERNRGADRRKAMEDVRVSERLSKGADCKVFQTRAVFLLEEGRELKNVGQTPEAQQKLSEAINELQRAFEGASKYYHPVIRNQMSLVYMEIGDVKSAVAEARHSAHENDTYVTNWMALARALIFAQKFGEAERAAQRGLEIAPAPPGRFWCMFLALVARVFAREEVASWKRDLNALEEVAREVPSIEEGYDLGAMWKSVQERHVGLPENKVQMLQTLATMAHLGLGEDESRVHAEVAAAS